ncbi:hypothetical protein [Streptomyces sp. CoH17]|uniref:hypothetical protein n=1 Tax=Streptomyces sp. CoH17 TaxID=2992806 RepID=UPI002270A7E7|nr:hypothetical protein [Streptomyces sp. CoH17]
MQGESSCEEKVSPDEKYVFRLQEDGTWATDDAKFLVKCRGERLQVHHNSHLGWVLMSDRTFTWTKLFRKLPGMERTWNTSLRLGAMRYTQLSQMGVIQDGRFTHHEELFRRVHELTEADETEQLSKEIAAREAYLEILVNEVRDEAEELRHLREAYKRRTEKTSEETREKS